MSPPFGSTEQPLRVGLLPGVTKTDEHAALPGRQVDYGLKRIWRVGHEFAEESQDPSRLANPGCLSVAGFQK